MELFQNYLGEHSGFSVKNSSVRATPFVPGLGFHTALSNASETGLLFSSFSSCCSQTIHFMAVCSSMSTYLFCPYYSHTRQNGEAGRRIPNCVKQHRHAQEANGKELEICKQLREGDQMSSTAPKLLIK